MVTCAPPWPLELVLVTIYCANPTVAIIRTRPAVIIIIPRANTAFGRVNCIVQEEDRHQTRILGAKQLITSGNNILERLSHSDQEKKGAERMTGSAEGVQTGVKSENEDQCVPEL